MPERRPSARQKRTIAERAGGRCEYCRCPAAYSSDPFAIEHILPRSAGGTDHLSNLALSCLGCNNLKYSHTEARDPVSGEIVPLYHPRRDRWEDHFNWNEDLTEIVGRFPLSFVASVMARLMEEAHRRGVRDDPSWLPYLPLGMALLMLVALLVSEAIGFRRRRGDGPGKGDIEPRDRRDDGMEI